MKVSLLEFFGRGLPEGFSFLFGVLILCDIKIQWKKYLLFSVILALFTYGIRLLPISYGVHTIFILIALCIIIINFFHNDIITTVKATVISAFILFACESLNILGIVSIYGAENLKDIIADPEKWFLSTLPSMVLFVLITTMIYFYKKHRRRKKEKNVKENCASLDK